MLRALSPICSFISLQAAVTLGRFRSCANKVHRKIKGETDLGQSDGVQSIVHLSTN